MALRWSVVPLFAVLAGGCAPLVATSGHVVLSVPESRVDVSIDGHDRRLIEQYYRHDRGRDRHRSENRHGRSRPPFARHERLPRGLRREPLPRNLERRLAPLPPGYVRVRVGHDVVLLDRRTNVVIDFVYTVE